MNRLPTLVFAAALALLGAAQAAAAAVPGQFVAKMYTEALGRAPDPAGWSSATSYFNGHACNQAALTTWGEAVFTSTEFQHLAYDHGAQVLVMYRAILNREPDVGGYAHWLSQLDAGAMTTQSLAASFFKSDEFVQLVPQICAGGSYSFDAQSTTPALRVATDPKGQGADNLTEAQLQSMLDGAAPGSTVFLRQKSLVQIVAPLRIPDKVTLATYGYPDPQHHANMARLVRAAPFADAMVTLSHGGSTNSGGLKSVWVDGQRRADSAYVASAIDIEIYGGKGVVVASNFVANSLGWSTIHSFGSVDHHACAGNSVVNNLVTAYPATHYTDLEYTDGLSIGCENSTVTGNAVVDATDVGIVVFAANPVVQRSLVRSNTVVSAGNSAFAGLAYDGLQVANGVTRSAFRGSSITGNTLWSSPSTHFIFGISVGTRPWFRGLGLDGENGTVTGNTSAGIPTNVNAAVSVSGMFGATVTGNAIDAVNIPAGLTTCSSGGVVIDSRFASGNIQKPNTQAPEFACIGDKAPN